MRVRSFFRLVVTVSCAGFGVMSGCDCDDETVTLPGIIEGRACDAVTRQGLPNIVVEVRGATTKRVPTDGAGRFVANGLVQGDYTVVAFLDADTEQDVTLPNTTVAVEPDKTTTVLDPRCGDPPPPPDSGIVDGQVCNRHTGELISDATIEVIGADNSVLASGPTDDFGRFEIEDVPEGNQIVSIRAPNFARSFPVTIVAGERVTLDLAEGGCEVPFGSACQIVGSLCDPRGPDGALLAGATVTATAPGQTDITDITDLDGEFYLSPLLPGRYTVNVTHTAAGVNETFTNVACNAGEETAIVGPDACADRTPIGRVQGKLCILEPNEDRGRFTGTVILKSGAVEVARTTTDSEGAFRFTRITPGTYALQLGEPALRTITPVVVRAFQTSFVEENECPEPEDICQEFTHEPEVSSDGRILFVVDRSGSMNNNFGAQSKWDTLKSALSSVTGALASTLQYGLFVYPNPAQDAVAVNCSQGAQRQAMGGSAAQINSALNAVNPLGGTSTATTMTAVRSVVSTLQQDARPLAVVLATDGAPNCNFSPRAGVSNIRDKGGTQFADCTCTSNVCAVDPVSGAQDCQSDTNCALFNCLDDVTTTGAIGQISQLGIQTHVIGIPDTNIPAGQLAIFNQSLNDMAIAGGAPLSGSVRYHQATSLQALQSSLQAVTRRILACQITVPTALAGATSIEVRLGTQPIPEDPARRNGWAQTGPSSIQLFGSACDAATASLETVRIKRCARP